MDRVWALQGEARGLRKMQDVHRAHGFQPQFHSEWNWDYKTHHRGELGRQAKLEWLHELRKEKIQLKLELNRRGQATGGLNLFHNFDSPLTPVDAQRPIQPKEIQNVEVETKKNDERRRSEGRGRGRKYWQQPK